MKFYARTLSTCRLCGQDVPSFYLESDGGMYLEVQCPQHGNKIEMVEKDVPFFKAGYEYRDYDRLSYLIFPVTYRCNLKCKYCYAHSNYSHSLPADRSIGQIIDLINNAQCRVVNLAGGEPTVREDLCRLISAIKAETRVERLCVVTNGQKTISTAYLENLKNSGMDFLFLPIFIPGYDENSRAMKNARKSLENAKALHIPTWIQATIDHLDQIDRVRNTIDHFRKILFNITIRAASPYGITLPEERIFISDIIKHLGKEDDWQMGNHPFNRHVFLSGKKTKVSSWVNDRLKLDPYDAKYILENDTILPFHKSMILDDILFNKKRLHC